MEFARMAEAPLKGIRVVDLGWLTAGAATSTPASSHLLGRVSPPKQAPVSAITCLIYE